MRLFPYLGIIAALFFVLLIGVLLRIAPVTSAPIAGRSASSTLTVLSGTGGPAITIENLLPGTIPLLPGAENRATASAAPPAHKKSATLKPVSAPVLALPPVTPISGNVSLDAAAAALRAALVNIVCYAPAGSPIKSISASGVIITPSGIVLTNAHVAQYFLLADHSVSCELRTGSPAVDRYRAALMFISRAWLSANPSVLTESSPAGDGEHDYAFLAIIGSTPLTTSNSTPGTVLSTNFPAIVLDHAALAPDSPVAIASYGAQFLDPSQIQSTLFPTIVFGSVKQVFTFTTDTPDVLALGGSAAAQEGSSGGGVADAAGELAATITTSTVEGATDTRNVNAITAAYIQRAYAEETGSTLETLLAGSPVSSAAAFASQIPALEALITTSLH
ncbi:trypsin-like peptidase domain-containing protein [Candidatus Kaiserbacteria bacterium]|nr:trypsin-like peptidase domain-containing protein [Candidatus Kaiserbacteria bacterium]